MKTLYCYCDGKHFWFRDRPMPLSDMERHADKTRRTVSMLRTYEVNGAIEAALDASNQVGHPCDSVFFSCEETRRVLEECARFGWDALKDVFPERVNESLEFCFEECRPYGYAMTLAKNMTAGLPSRLFLGQVGYMIAHAIGMGVEARHNKFANNN